MTQNTSDTQLPGATEFSSKTPKSADGLNLLDYLETCIPRQSREQWQSLINEGAVLLDTKRAEAELRLQPGQKLSYRIRGYQEPEVPTDWQLLWENSELVAVHKPAGLPVSRTTRNVYNTLVQLIGRESSWPDVHLLHRLDKETSGIILLGKNKQAAQRWQPRLKSLLARKTYRAIVHGEPQWDHYTLSCKLSPRDDSPIRCQMHICHPDEKGKESQTRFRVLQRGDGFSLIECELLTGRKHQIRAHLAHLGHPIVGDKIYAHGGHYFLKRCKDGLSEQDLKTLGSPHHLLHAYRVELNCPGGQILTDTTRSEYWLNFCEKVGICEPR
ncbi:pseudouridine synthase [Dongshaea marina]|uniref:pseudouridine synthase n=1 Tax=Dongshaea marina TaxID=2047966 RepID=UPI00131F3BA1|nr:pseudouridine synthase [Dongshaea marina]